MFGVVRLEDLVNIVEEVGRVVGLVVGPVVGPVEIVVGYVGEVVGAGVVGTVVGEVGAVEGVVKGAGVVGMTMGPFIASTIVLIKVNGVPSQVPWKSSVSMDQTMAPPRFM